MFESVYTAVKGLTAGRDLAHDVELIFRKLIYYPKELDFQYKILTAYTFIPSHLCSVLPHLVCYGPSGCGKSAVPKIISELNGNSYQVFQGATTTVALRNAINLKRFEDEVEQPFFLLWDDIDYKVLRRDNNLLSILKSSYSRKTEVISISGGQGMNLDFKTFCPKVISTIHDFWNHPEFNELQRRILVLFHDKVTGIELPDIDYLEFQGYSRAKFLEYWGLERQQQLKTARRSWSKKLSVLGNQSKIWVELFAISQVIGIDLTLDTIEQYKNNYDNRSLVSLKSIVIQLLDTGNYYLTDASKINTMLTYGINTDRIMSGQDKIIDFEKLTKKLRDSKELGGIVYDNDEFLEVLRDLASYNLKANCWMYAPKDKQNE